MVYVFPTGNLHFKKGLRVNKLKGKIIKHPVRQEMYPGSNLPYQPQNIFYPNWDVQNGTQLNPQIYYLYPAGNQSCLYFN